MTALPTSTRQAARVLPITLTLAMTLLAACATNDRKPFAVATIQPASASTVTGDISFASYDGNVHVAVHLHGLKPGEHGFHVHERGDCSAPDAMSAGGHWNPTTKPHGPQSGMHHAGDMPAVIANAAGDVDTSYTLSGPADGYVGKAVIVHADPDDYKTQPTGNSGSRLGCGVIVEAKR